MLFLVYSCIPAWQWTDESIVTGRVRAARKKLGPDVGQQLRLARAFYGRLAPLRFPSRQTYATLGVPYYHVSRIFMSRNFHPYNMVPHFQRPLFAIDVAQQCNAFQNGSQLNFQYL